MRIPGTIWLAAAKNSATILSMATARLAITCDSGSCDYDRLTRERTPLLKKGLVIFAPTSREAPVEREGEAVAGPRRRTQTAYTRRTADAPDRLATSPART